MRILVVHEIDYLEKVIYEIHEFPEMLAGNGHTVDFFQFQESANRNKKNNHREKAINGRVYSESSIQLFGPHQFGMPAIDRLWATMSCVPSLYKLLKQNRYDVILNYTVPTYGLQTFFLAKLFGIPFIHRALDVSHEIRQSIYKIPILLIEKFIYRYTKTLSVNNLAMKLYCERISGRKRPTFINYPPLDLEHFTKREKNLELAHKLGIENHDIVVTYMGSFFYFSGLPECILSFSNRELWPKSTKLLLIGGGEQEQELRDLVAELQLEDQVIFTGFVPYAELPQYLALADIAINPMNISQVSSTAFPHKVLQYLAMDLKVVSTRLDGLVSALDGVPGLFWANSSDQVMDLVKDNLDYVRTNHESDQVRAKLNELFSPATTLASLEETLYRSILENAKDQDSGHV